MSNYEFSVITPFHNVDLSVFEKTVSYMKKQTIGFDKIEWIVVLHNCKPEYVEGAKKLLSGYENVIVKVENNDAHTPSSPRNVGLRLATADYVGFLDADDNYREDAIEKIVYHLKKSGAQMVVFRREYNLESMDMMPISETVSWNQAMEEIIVTKGNSIEHRIYNDFPFFITSRAYDRRFLEENHMSFDEQISIAEDCYFNLEVIGKAEKICYLPQLIGYNYYINSGSILSAEKTEEEILDMLDSTVQVFEQALYYGVYANVIIRAQCFVMSRYLSSPKIKFETRVKVKEVLEPYWNMTTDIPEGRFVEPMNTLTNVFPPTVLFDINRYKNPGSANAVLDGQDVLIEILRANKNSDFGKKYSFADLLTKEGYQSLVPVSDYETYAPMIDLQTSIGEKNIFTSAPINWYLTAGKGQLFPVVQKQQEAYIDAFRKMNRGKNIFLWNEKNAERKVFNDGISSNTVWGISYAGYQDYFRYRNQEPEAMFTAPEEFVFSKNGEDLRYAQVLFALANEEVDQISASFNKDVISLFEFVEANWKRLCDDIENGTISEKITLSAVQKKILPAYLRKDKKRADALREIFEGGFHEPVAKKIWPKLALVNAAGTGELSEFNDRMKKYTGDVPVSNGYFATSAGLIGKAMDGSENYELLMDMNFYEFLPAGAKEGTRPVFAGKVKEQEVYSLIITTPAGLYRYKTNTVIHIEEIRDGKIIFSLE